MNNSSILLKISCLLWVFWGLVHVLAGVMTLSQDTVSAVQGIADNVDPSILAITYPDAAGAIIKQHGFNLLWIGAATIWGGILIWQQNRTAILVTAAIGGLTDAGYFIFIDLGGFNNFVPGTVMTIVSASAIVLSMWYFFLSRE